MSINITNENGFVQKVQYREKGKQYGNGTDSDITATVPFEEVYLQPGETLVIDPAQNWFKVIDMTPGHIDITNDLPSNNDHH